MRKRRLLVLLASFAVSAALLLVILRDVPVDAALESIAAADPGWLLLSFLLVAVSLLLRGIRWSYLLDRRIPIAQATHMVNVMFLGNQLPLRLGEVARGILATRNRVPLATSASSIVVERLLDTLIVVLMIAASVGGSPEVSEQAALFGAIALLGFFVLLCFARYPQIAHRVLDGLYRLAPFLNRLPLKSLLSDLLDGLQPLTHPRALLSILFWTLVAWGISLIGYYCLHLALGIETDYLRSVPLGASLAALSLALPVSIAGLGPFEGAIVLSGNIVGMDPLDAVSLGFLFHGVSVLSYAIWGALGLMALGVSPASAFRANSRPSDDGEAKPGARPGIKPE